MTKKIQKYQAPMPESSNSPLVSTCDTTQKNTKVVLKSDDEIQYKLFGNDEWTTVVVLSRAEKASAAHQKLVQCKRYKWQ